MLGSTNARFHSLTVHGGGSVLLIFSFIFGYFLYQKICAYILTKYYYGEMLVYVMKPSALVEIQCSCTICYTVWNKEVGEYRHINLGRKLAPHLQGKCIRRSGHGYIRSY